eukprot:3510835-Prymnesium_polylepis.2
MLAHRVDVAVRKLLRARTPPHALRVVHHGRPVRFGRRDAHVHPRDAVAVRVAPVEVEVAYKVCVRGAEQRSALHRREAVGNEALCAALLDLLKQHRVNTFDADVARQITALRRCAFALSPPRFAH